MVLEGAQGVKKSSLIAALVPQRAWFAEDLAGALNNKDALQGLSGKWLVELAELAATRKSTIEEVKSFMWRVLTLPSWSKCAISFGPKPCMPTAKGSSIG